MDDLERLYRQHASAVFRFAWGLSGDRAWAEDIVYLLAAARNSYLSGRRRAREVTLPEDMPAPEPDPVGRLDDRAQLESALRRLATVLDDARAHARLEMVMLSRGAAVAGLMMIVLVGGAVFAFFIRP
jgi:DNA-directed RNA polymerase specialized sigma24 family protein